MNKLFLRLQSPEGDGGAGGGEGNAPTPPPPPPPPSPPAAWFSDAHKDYVATKGFKTGDDALTSLQNAEKLIGAERAGRTLVLPKDDKDVEGIKAMRAKLGVPESPDKYELPLPQGDKGEFAKVASSWLHEAGVPKAAGQAIATKWNGYLAEQLKAAQDAAAAESSTQLEGLKGEWGDAFPQKSEEARRFMKAVGFSEEETKLYEETFGTANMLKRWASIGAKLSEPGFVGGGGGSSAAGDARTKLEELRAKRVAGTLSESEWNRLAPPLQEAASKAA